MSDEDKNVQTRLRGKLSERWEAHMKKLEDSLGTAPSEADEVRKAIQGYLNSLYGEPKEAE